MSDIRLLVVDDAVGAQRVASDTRSRDSQIEVVVTAGSDGLPGARAMVARGGSILSPDEETTVACGMPSPVARAAIDNAVLAFHQIAPEIVKRTTRIGASQGRLWPTQAEGGST